MPRPIIAAAFLTKLSKHLALLACLLILGRSLGRYEVGQVWIAALIVASAVLHLSARGLRHSLISTSLPTRRAR